MKDWKDARLETRIDYEGTIQIQLSNLDPIVRKSDLNNRIDEISSIIYKMKDEDDALYEEWKEIRTKIKFNDNKELLSLIHNILQGELFKFEKIAQHEVEKFEEKLKNLSNGK